MKFKVDVMPYTSDQCPFCENYVQNGECRGNVCRLDGYDCDYFDGKERDPLDCRHLIDDDAEEKLRNQGGI